MLNMMITILVYLIFTMDRHINHISKYIRKHLKTFSFPFDIIAIIGCSNRLFVHILYKSKYPIFLFFINVKIKIFI